jgi:hypothetical protein
MARMPKTQEQFSAASERGELCLNPPAAPLQHSAPARHRTRSFAPALVGESGEAAPHRGFTGVVRPYNNNNPNKQVVGVKKT